MKRENQIFFPLKFFLPALWLAVFLFCLVLPPTALAQVISGSPLDGKTAPRPTASPASETEKTATSSSIVERVVEKKEDITEPTPEVKGKLERFLIEHPPSPLTVTNFLQHAIREAIKNGVPANTIVLVLLFPLVATMIAASRHVVGIRGFGIFLPATLSVVFVSTGVTAGVLLFLTIITVATITRMFLRKLKLQYLPRMALLLCFVSLGVLVILFVSPFLNLEQLITVSIFPVLILVLTMENFITIQIGKSMKQALRMSFESLALAVICSLLVQLEAIQKFVLLRPEASVLAIVIADIYMGRYTGLRLLEHKKFKEILK